MIFGTTSKEKEAKKQQRLKADYGKPVKKFAWCPLFMNDGRYAWLENVFYVPQIKPMILGGFFKVYGEDTFFRTAAEALSHAITIGTAPVGVGVGSTFQS